MLKMIISLALLLSVVACSAADAGFEIGNGVTQTRGLDRIECKMQWLDALAYNLKTGTPECYDTKDFVVGHVTVNNETYLKCAPAWLSCIPVYEHENPPGGQVDSRKDYRCNGNLEVVCSKSGWAVCPIPGGGHSYEKCEGVRVID